MTERKFLYVQQDTGDKYLLKEADEGDTIGGAIPASSLKSSPNQIVSSNSANNITSVTVNTDELVGRHGSADISSIPATSVRTILNVQDGAAATVGNKLELDDPDLNIANVYSSTTNSGSGFDDTLNFKALKPISPDRLKMTTTENRVEMDALTVPDVLNIHGNNRVVKGNVFPLPFATQRMWLRDIRVNVQFAGSTIIADNTLCFQLYKRGVTFSTGLTHSWDTVPDIPGGDKLILDLGAFADGIKGNNTTGLVTSALYDANDFLIDTGDFGQGAFLQKNECYYILISGKYENLAGGDASGNLEFVTFTVNYALV